MNIRPDTIAWIMLLVFSWKCEKVSVLEAAIQSWKQAVLDCYGNNSFLDSNTTVLKQYMVNHKEVNDSIWVGSFVALLPWIEIRGCYNIPLTCNSFETDEKNAANLQLCQLKCMNRQYFAFNHEIERCVCFDEHDVVKEATDNASFCGECISREDCNTRTVVYKVFDRPITLAGKHHDCLSYQCNHNGTMPVFYTQECFQYSRSFCRDGRRTDGSDFQNFFEYRDSCEKNHYTYPQLHSENPVKLCDASESLILGEDIWVGVYRQTLYIDNSDKTVMEDFNKIEQYILSCDYLPTNEFLVQAENCSVKQFYKCSSDTLIKIQKDTNTSSTSTHLCRSEDLSDTPTSRSTGIIVGIGISISVLVLTISVILAFVCRRKYKKDQLSLNTDCRRDRHTNEIDNSALNSDYQQRDNVDDVQEKPKPYDQLQVRLHHGNIDNEQTNTSVSRMEYSKYESIIDSNGIHTNTVILEYEELHKAEKDTSTQSYDQLNVTRIVQSETTSIFFKHKLSIEKDSKIQLTNSTAVTSEYAQLDNAEKDKSPNVYVQLHVTDDTIGNKQTNYNSKTMILRDQQSKNEQTEETTALNNMTVTSEYEQWISAKKDKSVNVYDQLDVANVIGNDPTHHNPCQ